SECNRTHFRFLKLSF
ncbi:hypothetical protein D050_4838B, partial [Vibrio parahaemolyticus VPCR-2009]